MTTLNRDEILSAEDFRYGEVDVPELGGKVRIRSLSGAQRSFINHKIDAKNTDDLDETFVMLACVDEKGDRLFSQKDLPALQKKSSASISKIAKAVIELSRYDKTAEEIDIAEQNFTGTTSEDSSIA